MSGNLHYLKTHGKLTVLKDWIAVNPRTGVRYRACICVCECGTIIPLLNYAKVKNGEINHCGCKK